MKIYKITKDVVENAKVLKQIPCSDETRIIFNIGEDSAMLEFANDEDMKVFSKFLMEISKYQPHIVEEHYTCDEQEH